MVEVTFIVAFVAGLASFLSPCVLPLVPAFLAYLSGTSISKKHARLKIFMNSVAYVIGFSVVFAILGVLLNTTLATSSQQILTWLSRIGGIIIILFSLYILHIINVPFLNKEYNFTPKRKFSVSYLTSFLFGASFAVGWTPCVGAILGSVLTLAATQPSTSFGLLMAYSLGLGIPFLVVGLFTSQAIKFIGRSSKFLKYFNIIVGIFLLVIGILVFTNKLNLIANLALASFFMP